MKFGTNVLFVFDFSPNYTPICHSLHRNFYAKFSIYHVLRDGRVDMMTLIVSYLKIFFVKESEFKPTC